jgi:hypothetical protein
MVEGIVGQSIMLLLKWRFRDIVQEWKQLNRITLVADPGVLAPSVASTSTSTFTPPTRGSVDYLLKAHRKTKCYVIFRLHHLTWKKGVGWGWLFLASRLVPNAKTSLCKQCPHAENNITHSLAAISWRESNSIWAVTPIYQKWCISWQTKQPALVKVPIPVKIKCSKD